METENAWIKCDHPHMVVCRRIIGDGREVFYRQCTTCGTGHAAKKATLSVSEQATEIWWDDDIRARWDRAYQDRYTAIYAARQAEMAQQQDAWWQWYNRYLASPAWKAKRLRTLERDRYMCQGCGVARATQVHHLTYDRVGDEMLFDLASVCEACHQKIHDKKEAAA